MIYARAFISAGLLVLAGLLFFFQPTTGNVVLATTIVGGVTGYWLAHGEQKALASQNNGTQSPK